MNEQTTHSKCYRAIIQNVDNEENFFEITVGDVPKNETCYILGGGWL